MAPQLWILRHGDAVPHDSRSTDGERELTPRGVRQSIAAGVALSKLGIELSACYASPKVRARDTARLCCRALNVEPQELEALADGFDVDDVRELRHAHGDGGAILVVGHEPDLSQVVHDLTGARVDMKKGGVAAVELSGGSGTLVTLLRPKELESLAVAELAGADGG